MSWEKKPVKIIAPCLICNKKIEVGEECLYAKGIGIKHEKCAINYWKETRIQIHWEEDKEEETRIQIPEKFLIDFNLDESNLTILTERKKVDEIQKEFEEKIYNAFTKLDRIRLSIQLSKTQVKKLRERKELDILTKGERDPNPYKHVDVYWIENCGDKGIWWTYEKLENANTPRHRNLFGLSEPKWERINKRWRNQQVCEINPAFDGSNVNAVFVSDKDGNTYLATKNVGGMGGRGKHKRRIEAVFANKTTPYSIQFKNEKRKFRIICQVNSEKTFSQLSFFLQTLHSFKKQFEDELSENQKKQLEQYLKNETYQEKIDSTTNENVTLDIFPTKDEKRFVHIRMNQNKFKKSLLKEYDGKCAFCGFDEEEYLIGAHIVPYHIMRKKQPNDAMNATNGLLLCQLCHIAFDKDKITLNLEFEIEIDQKLKTSTNPAVESWIKQINEKMPIKPNSTYTPSLEYIREKFENDNF